MARSSARRPIISRETPAANKGFGERLRFDFSSLPLTHARRLWNEKKRYGGNKGRGIKLFFLPAKRRETTFALPHECRRRSLPRNKTSRKKVGFLFWKCDERKRKRTTMRGRGSQDSVRPSFSVIGSKPPSLYVFLPTKNRKATMSFQVFPPLSFLFRLASLEIKRILPLRHQCKHLYGRSLCFPCFFFYRGRPPHFMSSQMWRKGG